MIHICYALYDKDGRYSKFTGTSMLSVLENVSTPPPSVIIHILHDNTLSQDNREKFIYIAGRYGQVVKFYNVEELCQNRLNEIKKVFAARVEKTTFSIAMFYRFFAVEVLDTDIEKLIYLDSDVIVNMDIDEFWQIELGNKPLAAVTEFDNGEPQKFLPLCLDNIVKYENYFNSGVLLQNLKVLRNEKNKINQGIKFIAENPQYPWFDQDILNYCFAKKYLKLPLKFNQTVRHARSIGENVNLPKIYHYNARVLNLNLADNFNRLWLKYFVKTPWFNEEVFGHLYEGVRQIYDEQKKLAITISELTSVRSRAFFVPPPGIEIVKKLFNVKQYEEIIPADSQKSLQRMINSLQLAKGSKIFFVVVNEFADIYRILTLAGFTFGKDFINALDFLSGAEGVPFDSYPLVALM